MVDLILTLKNGEDINIGLRRFAKQNEINNGFIIGAVGAIKEFQMVSHGRKRISRKNDSKIKRI